MNFYKALSQKATENLHYNDGKRSIKYRKNEEYRPFLDFW